MLSIKKRIVLWYTVWMVAIISLILAVLSSGSGTLVERRTKALLTEKVHERAEEIEINLGRIRVDEDISFFEDGVYMAVYSSSGNLIAGRIPRDVPLGDYPENQVLVVPGDDDGSWYLYWIQLSFASDSSARIIGAIRAQDMSIFFSAFASLSFWLIVVIAVLSSIGGYIIVRRSLRPAERVVRTAGEIAGGSDLSKRIGLREGSGEIHQMAAAFDKMLSRLEAAFERERQFTDDASHELRTPISVILAECGYARAHIDDTEKISEAIGTIEAQAGRMSRLVSALLSIARSEKGTLTPVRTDVDLSELGAIVLETMEDRAGEKGISLYADIEPDVHLYCDHDMLMAMMVNLLSNAISYGREGGMARLSIKDHGTDVMISVSDDGIGIAEKDINRIWDRFYQADPSRRSGGAGLGLPIVRILAESHGGSAAVESVIGKGSVFTVQLPKEPSPSTK